MRSKRFPIKSGLGIHARSFAVRYRYKKALPGFIRMRIGMSMSNLYTIRGGRALWDWRKKKAEMQAW